MAGMILGRNSFVKLAAVATSLHALAAASDDVRLNAVLFDIGDGGIIRAIVSGPLNAVNSAVDIARDSSANLIRHLLPNAVAGRATTATSAAVRSPGLAFFTSQPGLAITGSNIMLSSPVVDTAPVVGTTTADDADKVYIIVDDRRTVEAAAADDYELRDHSFTRPDGFTLVPLTGDQVSGLNSLRGSVRRTSGTPDLSSDVYYAADDESQPEPRQLYGEDGLDEATEPLRQLYEQRVDIPHVIETLLATQQPVQTDTKRVELLSELHVRRDAADLLLSLLSILGASTADPAEVAAPASASAIASRGALSTGSSGSTSLASQSDFKSATNSDGYGIEPISSGGVGAAPDPADGGGSSGSGTGRSSGSATSTGASSGTYATQPTASVGSDSAATVIAPSVVSASQPALVVGQPSGTMLVGSNAFAYQPTDEAVTDVAQTVGSSFQPMIISGTVNRGVVTPAVVNPVTATYANTRVASTYEVPQAGITFEVTPPSTYVELLQQPATVWLQPRAAKIMVQQDVAEVTAAQEPPILQEIDEATLSTLRNFQVVPTTNYSGLMQATPTEVSSVPLWSGNAAGIVTHPITNTINNNVNYSLSQPGAGEEEASLTATSLSDSEIEALIRSIRSGNIPQAIIISGGHIRRAEEDALPSDEYQNVEDFDRIDDVWSDA